MTVRRISPLLRRGTAADWEASNPVLRPGEFGIETAEDGAFFDKKCGDGVTPWSELAYTSFLHGHHVYLEIQQSRAAGITLPDDAPTWHAAIPYGSEGDTIGGENDDHFSLIFWLAPRQNAEWQLRYLRGQSDGQIVVIANFSESQNPPNGLVTIPFTANLYQDGSDTGGFDLTDCVGRLEERDFLWEFTEGASPPRQNSLVLRPGEGAVFMYAGPSGGYRAWFHMFDTASGGRFRVPTPELPSSPTPQDIADALVAQGIVTQAS